MVESAFGHIRLLNKFDFDDICVSLKSSGVPMTMRAYQLMREKSNYPLHIGVTEAGTVRMGTLKSAVGIGFDYTPYLICVATESVHRNL